MAILATVSETEVEILADPDADQGQIDEIVAKAEAEFVEEPPEAEEVPAEDSDGDTAGPVVESGGSAGGGEASVLDPPDSTPPADEAAEPVAEEAEQS